MTSTCPSRKLVWPNQSSKVFSKRAPANNSHLPSHQSWKALQKTREINRITRETEKRLQRKDTNVKIWLLTTDFRATTRIEYKRPIIKTVSVKRKDNPDRLNKRWKIF